jgi:hypothetical protein
MGKQTERRKAKKKARLEKLEAQNRGPTAEVMDERRKEIEELLGEMDEGDRDEHADRTNVAETAMASYLLNKDIELLNAKKRLALLKALRSGQGPNVRVMDQGEDIAEKLDSEYLTVNVQTTTILGTQINLIQPYKILPLEPLKSFMDNYDSIFKKEYIREYAGNVFVKVKKPHRIFKLNSGERIISTPTFNGKIIKGSDTLSSLGIKDGDTIDVTFEKTIVLGGGAHPSKHYGAGSIFLRKHKKKRKHSKKHKKHSKKNKKKRTKKR